jgi:beta-glucanase (GH16 family)
MILASCEPTAQVATPAPARSAVPEGWQLVWQDEFQGSSLDPAKWKIPSYRERSGQRINSPGTVSVADGALHLTSMMRDGKLHGPVIETRNTRKFRYGYFEGRIRFQHHQGHHGAFWLQTPTFNSGNNDPAKFGAEIDIIEWFGPGRRDGWAGMNVYYQSGGKALRSPSVPRFDLMGGPDPAQPSAALADLGADFHTYGLLWAPEKLVFSCDGVVIMREERTISHIEQYLVLSLLSSAWERPRLKPSALPDTMLVDYVRVYQPVL